jgi:hypothetical protein
MLQRRLSVHSVQQATFSTRCNYREFRPYVNQHPYGTLIAISSITLVSLLASTSESKGWQSLCDEGSRGENVSEVKLQGTVLGCDRSSERASHLAEIIFVEFQ